MTTPASVRVVVFQHGLGALDYAVPLLRADRADLYVFAHEPHQKFQPRHKLAVYERNLDWFRFWLMGTEDPDPAKASQYAYWRLMRARASDLGPPATGDGLFAGVGATAGADGFVRRGAESLAEIPRLFLASR